MGSAPKERSTLGPLLHRWLVEYNPLYLLSAALVFGGLTLVSCEVAMADSVWAHLGAPALAELYALALIGGAAFLVRLGRRRPAAMLGLLAVLFQGDLMLHVETSSYFGLVGRAAASVWLLLFVAKLHLLGRALELRFSRSAVLVATFGASGLAILPHLLRLVDPETRTVVVTLWLFALGSGAAWTTRDVASAVGWDPRGRRCVHGAWAVWAVLAVGHAAFWAASDHFDLGVALAVVPLIGMRYARRESTVWVSVGLATVVALALGPQHLWVVSLMAAVALFLVATRARLVRSTSRGAPQPAPPYRSYESLHPKVAATTHELNADAGPRLLMGTLLAVYLAGWTAGWTGGAMPEHLLWVDALVVVGGVALSRRWRRPALAAPLGAVWLHLAVQRQWVSAPTTALEWGAASIGVGFILLFGSLGASWWLTRHGAPGGATPPGPERERPDPIPAPAPAG